MRYCTPELLSRIRSPDEDVSVAAHHDWERAIVRYQRRWQKIRTAFPKDVQRFEKDQVCLHDAQVLSMGQNGDAFVFALRTERPTQRLVVLTFTLDGAPRIDPAALPGRPETDFITWMYEEFVLDRRKQTCFEVLLSNGWEVQLPFRDFQFLMVPEIRPRSSGGSAPVADAAMPRSA